MIRIFFAVLFTLAIVNALGVLAPEGYWIYIAELIAGTTGMTALCILTKTRQEN